MLLSGCMAPASIAIKLTPSYVKYAPPSVHRLRVCASAAFLERKLPTMRGGCTLNPSVASTTFIGLDCLTHTMPTPSRSIKARPRGPPPAPALSNSYSSETKSDKPRWWWRTLACVPYLLPLHEAWMYADHTFKLHPYLENFEFLADPFLDTLSLMPNWFMMAAMYAIYLGVVRRKDLPRFLRFHIVMALLMSLALQATAIVGGWMPGSVFRGRMACLWMAAALFQMFMVVKCMKSSLCGAYAEVPFLSEAADTNLRM